MSGIYDPLRPQAAAQGGMITPIRLHTEFDGAATPDASNLTAQLTQLRAMEASPVQDDVFPPESPLLNDPRTCAGGVHGQ